ncbi:hypothetical protein BDW62DRAFT_209625 [Aspergillus aurantiobrunneus]
MTVADPSTKPQTQRSSPDADPDTLRQLLVEDGACFNRELDRESNIAEAGAKSIFVVRFSAQSKYVGNLPGISKTFREDILNSPCIHGVAKSFFRDTGDYWLTASFLRELWPGHGPQHMHRDEAIHPLLQNQKPGSAPITLSCILALTDFTRQNGATRVILGSHKWAEIDEVSDDMTVLAEMKPWDMLLLAQGCQLAQFETFKALSREIVESMSPLAQKMIGWRSTKPCLPNVSGLNTSHLLLLEDILELQANKILMGIPN